MKNETQPNDSSPEPTEYRWLTPSGETVPIPYEMIAALAMVERAIPDARCGWYRVRGGEWRRP